jgi:hypothetical protein
MDVAIAATLAGGVGSAVSARAATIRDRCDLLDINVDQLTRTIPLIPHHWFRGCSITTIETTHADSMENVLHCRRGQTDFVADLVGAPAALAA